MVVKYYTENRKLNKIIVLIKSDGGYRPYEVRQPDCFQGAKSCGLSER